MGQTAVFKGDVLEAGGAGRGGDMRHFPHGNASRLPARAVVGLGDELGGRDDFNIMAARFASAKR